MRIGPSLWFLGLVSTSLAFLAGCGGGPTLLKPEQQAIIDRALVEYPPNTELRPYVEGLTGPTAIAFDNQGNLLIAESGMDREPRIYGFKPSGQFFEIYPKGTHLPFNIPGGEDFRIYGPVGGMVPANGKIYVTHRDSHDRGVITAFGYDGSHTTIIADLPAEGDYSVTDIAVNPNGRLYFGMGAATNSGVVGIDNMRWLQDHRNFCDQPAQDIYLLGRRFDTPNPFAGIFGGTDIAVTAPFQPFGKSLETRIAKAPNNKPNAAIYSVDANGGDLHIEATGIRYPAGLGFSERGLLFMTNQGMKLRGTRPVADDPDVLYRLVLGQWYGWPDFSANLQPIYDPRFLTNRSELIIRSGYRDLSFLIDHDRSGLRPPDPNSSLVSAEFRPLSGAAKFDFAPASGPLSRLRQAGTVAIVALCGDRAPFDTGNLKLVGPTGYKIVQVNIDDHTVKDFVRNTLEGPGSRHQRSSWELERPVDAKFGPDGALYILDAGRMDMKDGRERFRGGTGKIYKLVGLAEK